MRHKRSRRMGYKRRSPRYEKEWVRTNQRWSGERIRREFNARSLIRKKVS